MAFEVGMDGPARRLSFAIGLVLLLASASAGCAGGQRERGRAPNAEGETQTTDWERPQPFTTDPMGSLDEAQGVLPFTLLVPKFGPPDAIFASKNKAGPIEDKVLFLVYHDADRNPFWIVELAAGLNWHDNFDELVAACTPPQCSSRISVVQVRGNTRALLIEAQESTLLLWREGSIEMRVQGPATTFPASQAVDTANDV
jgi:hypothetical protein